MVHPHNWPLPEQHHFKKSRGGRGALSLVVKESWSIRGLELIRWPEGQWEASKKITWKGDITPINKQTSRLYESIGSSDRSDSSDSSDQTTFFHQTIFSPKHLFYRKKYYFHTQKKRSQKKLKKKKIVMKLKTSNCD